MSDESEDVIERCTETNVDGVRRFVETRSRKGELGENQYLLRRTSRSIQAGETEEVAAHDSRSFYDDVTYHTHFVLNIGDGLQISSYYANFPDGSKWFRTHKRRALR